MYPQPSKANAAKHDSNVILGPLTTQQCREAVSSRFWLIPPWFCSPAVFAPLLPPVLPTEAAKSKKEIEGLTAEVSSLSFLSRRPRSLHFMSYGLRLDHMPELKGKQVLYH